MQNRFFRALFCVFLLSMATAMFGQGGIPVPGDNGTFSQFGISTAHDSSVGWTTELDTAVGYDFNRAFSVRAGIPFYLVSGTTTTTTSTGTTSTTQQYNSVGDAFLGLSLHPQFEKYAFALGLVGTAPTGSRTNGISTGRATATLSGRVETYISRFTPFVEGTFGNSLTTTTRYSRPFTTLGTVSTWTGGTGIDLTKKVSFEASAFYVQPFGDQKIYSHNMGGTMGAGSGMGGSMGGSNGKRPFEQAVMTSGTASIAKDHGFSGDLGFSPTRRVSVDVAYTRSIAYALDTYSAGLSFRLGHMPGKKADE